MMLVFVWLGVGILGCRGHSVCTEHIAFGIEGLHRMLVLHQGWNGEGHGVHM